MQTEKPQRRIACWNSWKLRASMREQNALEIIAPNGNIWCVYVGHREGIFQLQGTITAFAWSPDGTQVVSASSTGSIHIWSTNGTQQQVLRRANTRFAPAETLTWDEKGVQY